METHPLKVLRHDDHETMQQVKRPPTESSKIFGTTDGYQSSAHQFLKCLLKVTPAHNTWQMFGLLADVHAGFILGFAVKRHEAHRALVSVLGTIIAFVLVHRFSFLS